MDARDRLREYLEQRRELGESEFVLDGLSVEDALNALGVRGAAPGKPSPREARESGPVGGDWRAALRSVGVDQPEKPEKPEKPAKPAKSAPATPPAAPPVSESTPEKVGRYEMPKPAAPSESAKGDPKQGIV